MNEECFVLRLGEHDVRFVNILLSVSLPGPKRSLSFEIIAEALEFHNLSATETERFLLTPLLKPEVCFFVGDSFFRQIAVG